jgi:anti-sigma B factor antagonist
MTFDIKPGNDGTILFIGRLDAAHCAAAQAFVDARPEVTVYDFTGLEYISSAGLGVLLRVQKRLLPSGQKLKLCKVSSHIFDIFRYSGFDQILDVERA